MDFDRSSISPTDSASKSPGMPQIPQLKIQNQSFSSFRSINLGRTNSPRSQDEENEYILGETKKLIQKGKYTKAFINLRRYLMDQDLNKSILPEFYQQVVHVCHKLVENYFLKPPAKILSKVPPLMSIVYQHLNQWDSFLVSLQGEQDCQNLIFGKSASVKEQVLLKKASIALKESQEDKSPLYKLSRFQRDNSRKNQRESEDAKQNTSLENLDDPEQRNKQGNQIKLEIGSFQFEPNDKLGNYGNELDGSQFDKFNPLILIKDKFHLYREQMLAYYLKTLHLSYRFHRLVNQPMRSLKFLIKGSDIVRDFLSNLLFISSAELSRIATKIELTRGNIHMELNQIDQAMESYEYAQKMGRNTMEIWFKIIGGYSKQDIPIKLEVRCEKSIIQFIQILLVQSTCYEMKNQYSRALETISLADWFAQKLLLYESSNPIKQNIRGHSDYMKDKYGDLLQEEAEIQKILRKFEKTEIDPLDIKQKEDTYRKQKIQEDLNLYLYNKSECETLNKNMKIIIKKPPPPVVKDNNNNKSHQQISSSENINILGEQNGKQQNIQLEYLQNSSTSQLLNQGQINQTSQPLLLGQEGVKNYLSGYGVKNIHNKSLSEVPSFFNEQATQLTGGIGTSKFYSFYGNQTQGLNSSKNKSFRGGFTGGNVIDQTLLGSGQNSQLNTNRQSFSIHGLDLQSIITYPLNQNNPNLSSNTPFNSQNQKNSSNEINLNGSFHTQVNTISPFVIPSLANYGTNNQFNPNQMNNNQGGGGSNNSSFIGQNLQFNNNNNTGSMPMMSDCNFMPVNANYYGLSSITTPRNQELSQVIQEPFNQSNQGTLDNLNKPQNSKQNSQQPPKNYLSKQQKDLDRRGTLEKHYQLFDRPLSAKSGTSLIQKSKLNKQKFQKQKDNASKKRNLSLNQLEINKFNIQENTSYRNSISQYHPQYIGSRNNLSPELFNTQGGGINPSLLYNPNNKLNSGQLNYTSDNRLTLNSATRLEGRKQGEGKKSNSQSKLGTINNINQQSYLSGKNQQQQKDEEGKKLKVITSELYINQEPPKFKEEPEKIEELKQKYRFMRDDENDVKEAMMKKEVKYRFMKIPLDQRRDLIDLDICMKKVIQEQLVQETDHRNYPYMHWVCGKTLQQVNMDKKEFQFADVMVQFKQKNGNGKSIPSVLEKEDTTFSMQRELKLFNEQTAIVQVKEKFKQQQAQDLMLDNQAFQKILDSNRIKPQQQNQDNPPPETDLDTVVKTGVSESMRGKLIKAAAVQKRIDDQQDGQTLKKGERASSLFANMNQKLEDEKFKKRSNNTHHQLANSIKNQKQNQTAEDNTLNLLNLQQQLVEKADTLLKQSVLYNEQEREKINKQIELAKNKHTKINMNDLIHTLIKKQEEPYIQKTSNTQKQQSMNQSSAVNDNNETGITHTEESDDRSMLNSRTQKFKNQHSSPVCDVLNRSKIPGQSKSTTNINPTYFNLDFLKKEFGNQLQSNDNRKSNIAFEVDKFLNLAQSTKNYSQMKLLKQSPFNITDVSLLKKLQNQENNGGGSTKNARNGKPGGVMPRRFTLLAQQKKSD